MTPKRLGNQSGQFGSLKLSVLAYIWTDSNSGQKVLQRLVKALLLRKRYSEAGKHLTALAESPERTVYGQVVHHHISNEPTVTKVGRSLNSARQLPYTKPHMDDVAEFYTVGHDTPGSMYDALIFHFAAESETLAFFYAGIGDARHAFQTIISIYHMERMLKEEMETKNPSFHFTLNDVKHEVLARHLIFLLLLERLCSELPADSIVDDHRKVPGPAKKTLLTLVYVYVAAIVPPEVYDDLQDVLAHAISSLRSNAGLPTWIDIGDTDAKAIISVLEDWQNNVAEAFPVEDFIASAKKGAPRNDSGAFEGGYCWEKLEPMKDELRQFCDCALIIPPEHAIHVDLQAILRTPKSNTRTSQLRDYLSDTWKGNVTLIDTNWVRQGDKYVFINYFDVAHNPFEFAQAVSSSSIPTAPKKTEQLFDWVAQFFLDVAISLAPVRSRLKVEFLQGDVARVLESIRYGARRDRNESYPVKYDRIHASNIP
jgi:hypothetical protein